MGILQTNGFRADEAYLTCDLPPLNWSTVKVSKRRPWSCPQRWTTCSEKIAADAPQGRHAGPEDFASSIGVFWPIELCGRN